MVSRIIVGILLLAIGIYALYGFPGLRLKIQEDERVLTLVKYGAFIFSAVCFVTAFTR